jgi:alcohol dehydrogenase (NADP+)
MTSVSAYAAPAVGEALTPTSIARREVGPHDVRIDIKFCGVCHSDIHTVRGEWGPRRYPLAPGHEIVGVVSEVGASVTAHSVGDRVGVGCMVNSCRECENCRAGEEQYCISGATLTYGSTDRDGTITQGGYSTQIVVNDDFVVGIPADLPFETAAPLLCAGATTYSPLRRWQAGPGKRVAVLGLGGLGHVAVKLAHAMGAEVTVLSSTLKKQGDGLLLGADHFYATNDPATFEKLAGSFDLILNTVSGTVDIPALLGLLRLDGAFVVLGASPEAGVLIPNSAISARRRVYTHSIIAGVQETQQMLNFCAAHAIGAEVEIIAIDEVNDAYERVLNSDVRYRFVIDISTL